MPSSQPTVRPVPGAASRAQRLKTATDQAHRHVDARILGMDIFASRAAFARFVRVQHRLHTDVQALYACPDILQRLPSVQGRQRIALIERDLADLAAGVPADHAADPVAGPLGYRLGWLYVVEGSALGGAVILKMAAGLGLHPHFGARHLAPAEEGVATAWRTFTAELDAIALDERQEALLLQGADAAFERVATYVAEASD